MSETSPLKPVSIWVALIPLVTLIILLGLSVYLYGDGSSSGANQIALLLAASVAHIIGWKRGLSWKELEEGTVEGISRAMGACMILFAVGSLIGAWMLAGTAPAMIYYGLSLLSPDWFYPATMVICAMVALSIGSSWTTAGTVGLALVGISQIMGLNPAMAAGAVISGAYFGDKLSPLSDTTNLAPAMVGTDLFTHIQHMLWTTVPSFIIALILFTILGWGGPETIASTGMIDETRIALENSFNLGFPTFLPLILLLTLAIKKVPAYPAIGIGALAGIVIAVTYQTEGVGVFVGAEEGTSQLLILIKGSWQALFEGYHVSTGLESLDELLSRGGMASMVSTVWLIITAMTFGASMEKTGLLLLITGAILKGVKGTGSLILTTVLTAIGVNIFASDQYMSIVLPGRMYKVEFAKRGLAPQNLSRTIEDAGTMTSALVPWNTCGAFMAGALGVPTLAYAPYAFLNILNPIIAVFYGFTNIALVKIDPNEVDQALAPEPAE